jgi:hypothetical protein
MNCLRSLGRCDHEFESHSGHGCLGCICVYSVSVLSCDYVEALRRADHSSKESYRLWIDKDTEKSPGPTRAVKPIKKTTVARLVDDTVICTLFFSEYLILRETEGTTSVRKSDLRKGPQPLQGWAISGLDLPEIMRLRVREQASGDAAYVRRDRGRPLECKSVICT